MNPDFFQTRARFLTANKERFTGWGEANNHCITGAGLAEFHALFVDMSSYYQRLRWVSPQKPVWYRQNQLSTDACDRFVGVTPYGKLFSKIAAMRVERQKMNQ
jgi:hypothetical protein